MSGNSCRREVRYHIRERKREEERKRKGREEEERKRGKEKGKREIWNRNREWEKERG